MCGIHLYTMGYMRYIFICIMCYILYVLCAICGGSNPNLTPLSFSKNDRFSMFLSLAYLSLLVKDK